MSKLLDTSIKTINLYNHWTRVEYNSDNGWPSSNLIYNIKLYNTVYTGIKFIWSFHSEKICEFHLQIPFKEKKTVTKTCYSFQSPRYKLYMGFCVNITCVKEILNDVPNNLSPLFILTYFYPSNPLVCLSFVPLFSN